MPGWDTSCADWEDRLLSGRTLVPDLPLFRDEAAKAVRIFKRLRVPDLIGRPTMGEIAGPWLYPIVEAIFGSFDPDTNRRMIQEFFWLISKKNGKTSSAAAIMVEALILNRRPEAEYVLIAPTKDIADRAFHQAAGTIRADTELEKLFQAQGHIRKITHRRTGAALQVKAADTDVITGGKQVGTLVDELHVLASKSDAADILLEIRGALTARPDGFLIIITTQSKKPPAGVFKSELAKARDVRDGKLQLPLLPILYELPMRLQASGEWRNPRYWAAVNPNLGRSVDEGFLTRELASAEREGAAQLALFASQHFDIEIGLALSSDRWAGAEFWQARAEKALTLEALLLRCEAVVIGIDGGGLDDLFGLCVLGRERNSRDWLTWSHAWCHEGVLERRKSIAPKLRDFEARGELTIVGDELGDVSAIIAIIADVKERGLLAEVGVDPAGLGEFVDALAEIDVTQENNLLIGVSQGYALMNAIKTVERKLANGTMRHSGSHLMAWCVGNLKIEPTATAIRATKQSAGDAKIDAAMAMFNAAARMSLNPQPGAVLDIAAMVA